MGEGSLKRERPKNRFTVRNSGAGQTRSGYESVRAGCGLRPSPRFSAGNGSRRSLHRQNFPYAVSFSPYKVSELPLAITRSRQATNGRVLPVGVSKFFRDIL